MIFRTGLALLATAVAAGGALAAGTAGPEVDVSRAPYPQFEVAVTADPTDPNVLLAASNSGFEHTMRVYSSTDGGATWTSSTVTRPQPPRSGTVCMADPGVAIDDTGRQYLSFIRWAPCTGVEDGPARLYVVTRPSASAPWPRPARPALPVVPRTRDDKPAIAVDRFPASPHHGRLYAAWSRVTPDQVLEIVASHSDDQGRTWSRPVKLNTEGRAVTYASLAVAADGTVYAAWDDATEITLRIARSTDGGATWSKERFVARYRDYFFAHCGSGTIIRAAGQTCVRPNPVVTVDTSNGPYRGRVYVTYGDEDADRRAQDVYLAAFDPALRPVLGYPLQPGGIDGKQITPPQGDPLADRFWPASSVDPSDGRLWVCFYDTTGDRARRSVLYSCMASTDGGRTFTKPVPAATVRTDETQPGASGGQYGDYSGLVAAGGAAIPAWTDSRFLATLGEEIFATRLTAADLP